MDPERAAAMEPHPGYGLLDRCTHLIDSGEIQAAVDLVRGLPVEDPNLAQVRGIILIEAGGLRRESGMISEGIEVLVEAFEAPTGISAAYNRANGHLALWEIAVEKLGVGQAHALHRTELHIARELFELAGNGDDGSDTTTRAQAWVNLGNSFASCGRHVEAVAAYDSALELVPRLAMALGRRGVTFLHRAALETTHRPALVCEAVADLDAALADPEGIVRQGGPGALARFKAKRSLISGTPTHEHDSQALSDPHLEWCRSNNLLLHPSPRCVSGETKILDRLPLEKMIVKGSEKSRHILLRDSLNSLLQDYVSARYLVWCVIEPDTDLRRHAASLGPHMTFGDTLTHARWGIGTGLRVAALASATNLLDKIAGVAHQYLQTGKQPRQAYIRNFGLLVQRDRPDRIDPVIGTELDEGNRGLLALCDLAGEIGRPTPLNELLQRRHAATHRTVAVHDLPFDEDAEPNEWLDRVEADALANALRDQLARSRAALIYLADTINYRDQRLFPPGPIPTLPMFPAQPERADS